MSRAPQVVLLALDAFDPGLARELAARGRLPAIAELLETGAEATMRNPYGLFVGALWPTLMTGRSAAQVGYHSWLEVDPETYERRPRSADELAGRPFWRALSDRGRRVAVVDVPHSRADGPLNGIEVSEWGVHDRHFGLRSSSSELLGELTARHGLHPVLGLDPYAERDFAPDDEFARAGLLRTPDEDAELTRGLLEGIDMKRRLSLELMEREPWSLFFSVFGESHAAGHHLWHHHDKHHPRHDPVVARELDDPLIRVYERLDQAVAEHLERCGPETTFVLLLSHGMNSHHDGTHLLEEVLRRLDLAADVGPGGNGAVRAAKRGMLGLSPALRRASRRPVAALVRAATRRRELVNWWGEAPEGDWTRQRFFLAPNNTVYGGVRINLCGREAAGLVEPGAEYERVCERLADDLLDLVNVDSGEPVVNGVSRTEEHYERSEIDALPDLLLDWNHRHPVETIFSAKTGIVHGRYDLWRTGDHRLDGLLLARGPDLEAGSKPPLRSIDLGPTLAARLGVELDGVDGEAVAWLAGDGPSAVVWAAATTTPRLNHVLAAGPSLERNDWSLAPPALELVLELVADGCREIVECGSGASTVLIARALRERGAGRLHAVEHDRRWSDVTRSQLAAEGLEEHARVIFAPLQPHDLAERGCDWYEEAALAPLPGGVDLLLVDGPPAGDPEIERSRYPALPALASALAPEAAIVLDDTDRDGERWVLERWTRELGVSFDRRADGFALGYAPSESMRVERG